MELFKKAGLKYCLLLLMLVMVAQAQQSAGALYDAASKGDPAALAQLKTLGNKGDDDAQAKRGNLYSQGAGWRDARKAAVKRTVGSCHAASSCPVWVPGGCWVLRAVPREMVNAFCTGASQ